MSELKVTSFESLQEYAKGQIVELPPFAEGQPFVARLVRPSLLDMVSDGTIPNPLIASANKLFAMRVIPSSKATSFNVAKSAKAPLLFKKVSAPLTRDLGI